MPSGTRVSPLSQLTRSLAMTNLTNAGKPRNSSTVMPLRSQFTERAAAAAG
jgi:hypothetical protein